jgi:MFS family permease
MRRVVLARFLSRAGSEAAFFVGIWGKAAFVMGASAYALAGIMFAVSLAMIAGSVVAGVLVDRFGPRKVLMYAEWLFVPAALSILFAETLPVLTVLVTVWAFVGAPVQTAAASFAPYLTDEDEQLRRVNAWIEGASSLSFAVGPAVGALVVRFAHVDWVFAIDAATSLAAAVLVSRVHLTPPAEADGTRVRGAAFAETVEGLRIVYSRRGLRYYVLAGSTVWLAFGAFGALEPLFFRDVVGTDIEAMGWMNAIFGTGFVVGAVLLTRLPRRIVSARGLAVLVGLTGLGTVLYVGWPDLRVIAIGAFFWSIVIGIMEPLLRTLLHRDAPKGVVGRVMGVAEIHHRAGEIVPLSFAPALAARFGVQVTLIGLGLLATVTAALSFLEAQTIDRLAADRGVPEVEPETIRSADEPFIPLL